MKQARISAVIPTYNRPHLLPDCVRSIVGQVEVGEILVVDDASTCPAAGIWAEMEREAEKGGVALRWERLPQRQGAGAARNRGVALSRYPLVLFVDDDVRLAPDFTARALPYLERGEADIVGGRVIVLAPGQGQEEARATSDARPGKVVNLFLITGDFGVGAGPARPVPYVSSVALWRKELFARGVFFPPYPGNGYREETDACLQALAQGAKIIFAPECVSFHLPPEEAKAPAGRARGGQWEKGRWHWYWWAVRNNHTFLDRHLPFLRSRLGVRWPRPVMELAFALRQTTVFLPPGTGAFLRRLYRGLLRWRGGRKQ
ncbi:MAG: glycosyltransferase [Bacillota bacterium]|nr:glycosyltransferase [Bacillota bacterium]